MKKTGLIIVALLLSIIHDSIAQVVNPTDVKSECFSKENTKSTNWNCYHTDPNNLDYFPNNFNWTTKEFTVVLSRRPGQTEPIKESFRSPFYFEGGDGSSGVWQLNTTHLYDGIPVSKRDFWPQQGWELLAVNMGSIYIDADKNKTFLEATPKPYFVLYNKYRALLRVFINVPNAEKDRNKAAVSVKLEKGGIDQKGTMFMSATGNVSYAHDSPNWASSNDVTTINKYVARDYWWMMAEFPVHYDPCLCGTNQNVRLEIGLNLADVQNINLDINGNITQDPNEIYDNANRSFVKDATSLFKGVANGFKSYDGMAKDVAKYLIKEAPESKDKIKDALTFSSNASVDVSANDVSICFSTIGSKSENGAPKPELTQWAKVVGSVASAVPYVGGALALFDFFAGSTTAAPPASSTVKLNASGNLTGNYNYLSDRYAVPGVRTTSQDNVAVPLYNNTLGVVDILKRPLLKKYNYAPKLRPARSTVNCENEDLVESPLFKGIRQFGLKENLKLALNPMAKVEFISADAAFVLEYDKRVAEDVNRQNYKIPFNPMLVEPNIDPYRNRITDRLSSIGWELERMTEGMVEGVPQNEDFIRYRSHYMPLPELGQFSFFLHDGTYETNIMPKIYVKVIITLKSLPDVICTSPTGQMVTNDVETFTLVRTIEVNPNDIEEQPSIGLEVAYSNTYFYPEYGCGDFYNNVGGYSSPLRWINAFSEGYVSRYTGDLTATRTFQHFTVADISNNPDFPNISYMNLVNNPSSSYVSSSLSSGNNSIYSATGLDVLDISLDFSSPKKLIAYNDITMSSIIYNWNNVTAMSSTGSINRFISGVDGNIAIQPSTFTNCNFLAGGEGSILFSTRNSLTNCSLVAGKRIEIEGGTVLNAGTVLGDFNKASIDFLATEKNKAIAKPEEIYTMCNNSVYIDEAKKSIGRIATVNEEEPITSPLTNEPKAPPFTLYPNPSTGYVSVVGDEISIIQVQNSQGQVVQCPVAWQGTRGSVDLSGQMNGMYFILINGVANRVVISR